MARPTAPQPLRIVPGVDEGLWDVPGMGLVKGRYLTLEDAKLALALYGAREHVLRRLATRLLRALDTTNVHELAELESGLEADDAADDGAGH